jgi:beta-lactamase superfamily II metal-dependent hydrolase
MIDVGWGDSILLESAQSDGKSAFALIDSNDTTTSRSTYIFLKRFFEKKQQIVPSESPIFDWVLLTHAHADHGQGLQRILKDFGTSRFWYSRSLNRPAFAGALLRYADRSLRVGQDDALDSSALLPSFDAASLQVIWPQPGVLSRNENDNSIVLVITLGAVCFVLTGDAEAEGAWQTIAGRIPSNTRFFKLPHHGAANGMFTKTGTSPWLAALPQNVAIGISSHVRPFDHPDPIVISALGSRPIYRTDQHYHITIETDGNAVQVSYSHV